MNLEEKCQRCQNGQKVGFGNKRLCDYGVQAIPIASMRHDLGLCGETAKLFVPVNKYSEYDI